ncbi:MAG: hypothetical protein ACK47B_14550 [Armatimonadota bacterium]
MSRFRLIRTVAALAAATLLVILGVTEWGSGTGWPMLLIAAAILAALALRHFVFPDR